MKCLVIDWGVRILHNSFEPLWKQEKRWTFASHLETLSDHIKIYWKFDEREKRKREKTININSTLELNQIMKMLPHAVYQKYCKIRDNAPTLENIRWAPVFSSCCRSPLPLNTPMHKPAPAFRAMPVSAMVSPTTIHSRGCTSACLHNCRSGSALGLPLVTSFPHIE